MTKICQLPLVEAQKALGKIRCANGFGRSASWKINRGSIDVYDESDGHPVRLTRVQLEFALAVMESVRGGN